MAEIESFEWIKPPEGRRFKVVTVNNCGDKYPAQWDITCVDVESAEMVNMYARYRSELFYLKIVKDIPDDIPLHEQMRQWDNIKGNVLFLTKLYGHSPRMSNAELLRLTEHVLIWDDFYTPFSVSTH